MGPYAIGGQVAHAVVPEHVVPAVQPHLVALGHQIVKKIRGLLGDNGAGQGHAVEHGGDPVGPGRSGAQLLLQKAGLNQAGQSAARVVRPHGDVKRGLHSSTRKDVHQAGHAGEQPHLGVYVHF